MNDKPPGPCVATASIPAPVLALAVPARARATHYPAPLRERVAGRQKRPLGDHFGLTNFGVNLTRLAPGAMSSLRHAHAVQDEFVYVLQGTPTLIDGSGRTSLGPGMCIGFAAGTGNAHHFVNESPLEAVMIEVGDRRAGDRIAYPDDDLEASAAVGGGWRMTHKDGTPY